MKDTISHSATNAMHGVVDTVKANPVPTLLTSVGLVWLMTGQNRRPDYLSAWWNVVNWDEAGRRYRQFARENPQHYALMFQRAAIRPPTLSNEF